MVDKEVEEYLVKAAKEYERERSDMLRVDDEFLEIIKDAEQRLEKLKAEILSKQKKVELRPNQNLHLNDDWKIALMIGERASGLTRTGIEFLKTASNKENNKTGVAFPSYQTASAMFTQLVDSYGPNHLNTKGKFKHLPSYKQYVHDGINSAIYYYSLEDLDRLRGHQFNYFWLDLSATPKNFPTAEQLIENIQLVTRLGDKPKILITTNLTEDKIITEIANRKDTLIKFLTYETNKESSEYLITH
jgi:phage terminase large subunit-like protein